MKKIISIFFVLVFGYIHCQNNQYLRFKNKIESILPKYDTILLVLNNDINYRQANVPIYSFQINTSKFESEKSSVIVKDSISGKLIYKNLPGEFDKQLFDNSKIMKDSLVFENYYFAIDSNKKGIEIGNENRIYFEKNNKTLSPYYKTSTSFISEYILYHSRIKSEYLNKYNDYVKFRNSSQNKKYGVRYSDYSPNFESGATGTINFKSLKKINHLIVYINSNKLNIDSNIIYLTPLYLDLILQQGKVFYLNFEKNINSMNDQSKFEEVKYQKFVKDS
jgi:hypothetical protein